MRKKPRKIKVLSAKGLLWNEAVLRYWADCYDELIRLHAPAATKAKHGSPRNTARRSGKTNAATTRVATDVGARKKTR